MSLELLAPALGAALAVGLSAIQVRARRRRLARRAAELDAGLDLAELATLEDAQDALGIVKSIARAVDLAPGPEGVALRARLSLIQAELASDAGRREAAREILERASHHIERLPAGDLRETLAARADTVRILAARMEEVSAEELEAGERALAAASGIERPEVLMRLVWVAHWMGRIAHRRGDWPGAQERFERAAALAERLEAPGPQDAGSPWSAQARERIWAFGRRAASMAMLELADVARTMGDRDASRRAYHEAVALLAGATSPEARLARARALLARGLQDVSDELAGPSARLELLEEAAWEAHATEHAAGWALAARAELEMARLRDSVGDPGRRAAHLASALEDAERAADQGVPLAVEAHFTMGSHLEQEDDAEEAREPLRAAYETGRTHADLHVRWIAFLAGTSLHANLIGNGDLEAAETLLDGLTLLVPVLAPEARARAAARVARSRAQQLRFENRPDDAEEAFGTATLLARQVDGADREVMMFRIASDWGGMLAESGRDLEAERRFSVAMEVPDASPDPRESAERAEVLVQRAQVRLKLDRQREAVEDLERAFDLGRNGGTPHGRDVAALAALVLGDAMRRETDERRRHYETAARLGLLSGSRRGKQVARAARQRIRAARNDS